ncbi:MAG TPA: glycosyltransferase family 1 protein [Terriglobales bacterium]|nr:glycosyltransferase family 1 protein [Terriglobales bacterium]
MAEHWIKGHSWTINGRFLAQRMTGVQRYAHEIVSALDNILADTSNQACTPMRLVLPPGVKTKPSLSKIVIFQTRVGSGHPWDQCVLPFYEGEGVLSLGNFGPVIARRHIVCIHDANTFILPESYSRAFRLAYRTLLPLVGKCARRVATVSRFSADMLVKHGICRAEKIFVAPNGHEHVLRWDARRAQIPLLGKLRRPYVLLLGSTAKHKNIEIIFKQAEALDRAGIEIVVAGGAFSIFSTSTPIASRPNIHHVGFVGDDELAALYEGALCLVFPSKTEGFGIPPLEAMAKGCPVISSNAASLIDVGGDAVLYVDPDDGDQWRETIIGLAGNGDLRASLSSKGRQRSALFSWRHSAELYLDEMERLASSMASHAMRTKVTERRERSASSV